MDDLISRRDVIDAFNTNLNELVVCGEENAKAVENYLSGVFGKIKCLPSAQPKRGRWIPVSSYSAFGGDEATWTAYGNPVAFHYCSECKEQAYAGEDGDDILSIFCPMCGAKMEVKE